MRSIRSVIGALRKDQKCESILVVVVTGGHQCRLLRSNSWSPWCHSDLVEESAEHDRFGLRRRNMRSVRGDLVEEIAHVDGLAQKSISFSVHKRSTKE